MRRRRRICCEQSLAGWPNTNSTTAGTLEKIEFLTHANMSAVSRLLRGDGWGSVPIIAQLERHLDIDLWGDEHRKHKLP